MAKTKKKNNAKKNPKSPAFIKEAGVPIPPQFGPRSITLTNPDEYKEVDSLEDTESIPFNTEEKLNLVKRIVNAIKGVDPKRGFLIRPVDEVISRVWRDDSLAKKKPRGKYDKKKKNPHPSKASAD